mgnify:CR=1 FL=1
MYIEDEDEEGEKPRGQYMMPYSEEKPQNGLLLFWAIDSPVQNSLNNYYCMKSD